MSNHFSKLFPGTKFIVSNTKEIRAKHGIENAEQVKAFVKNGEVVFNADTMTVDTPFHEYSHVYFEYLKKENPKLFNELIEQALKSPLHDEMKRLYKDLSDVDLGEEILAEMIARRVRGDLIKDDTFSFIEGKLSKGGLFSRVWDYLKRVFSKIFMKGKVNKDVDLTMHDSLGSFVDKLAKKLGTKGDSLLAEFSKTSIERVRLARQGADMNIKEARDLLIKSGFMKKVCA
jgi:hypothetical protein